MIDSSLRCETLPENFFGFSDLYNNPHIILEVILPFLAGGCAIGYLASKKLSEIACQRYWNSSSKEEKGKIESIAGRIGLFLGALISIPMAFRAVTVLSKPITISVENYHL